MQLSAEFGSWLINANQLDSAIKSKAWKIIDGIYFIEIDEMTVFEASHDGEGNIYVNFFYQCFASKDIVPKLSSQR